MKRFLAISVLIVLLAAPTASAASCSIMTFNVRYGTAKDGDNAWEHRRDFLVACIEKANPDIIGTQECLDFQAQYIVDNLEGYAWIGLGRQADGTGEMTAIIYRKGTLVPVETSHHWLSETPDLPGSKSWDSSLPRIATRVKFFHVDEKVPFVVYNTHFDHRGKVARQESAGLLVRLLEKETLPVLLTGDFNAVGGDSAPWQVLSAGTFRDAWRIAEAKAGPENTWNGFETPPTKSNRRIDWIMVSPSVTVSQCTIIDSHKDGRYPSDHFPVLAAVSFGPTR